MNPRTIDKSPQVELDYGFSRRHDTSEEIVIALWKPSGMHRAIRRDAARFCIRRYEPSIDGLRATIFGFYEPSRRQCEHRPPDGYTALAFFRGVAVTIDAGSPRSPYGSVGGLRALLRALRLRPPRPLPAPML